ncbi:MAG: hypothetical protein IJB82_03855 [Bacilli bacterium]|nr:hypothetical protein [Bacilli bacterium]
MELKKSKPKIFVISGKARHGKDTTAGYIKNYFENNGKKVINLQFSSYIKEYAKKISDWDGSEETKPRELLQVLGTEVIRKKIDEQFFIKRICSDIEVYSYFFDVIVISDARVPLELDVLKNKFENVYLLNVRRSNFDDGLTEEQRKHYTELALDDYNNFDKIIENSNTLKELELKVINYLEEVLG